MNAMHVINACVVAFNLFVLLPNVWRYGFDWKILALICIALTLAIGSSVGIILSRSAA